MRKRNCEHLFDTIFWYFIYSLPFLLYFIYYTSDSSSLISFSNFFSEIGFGFVSDNIIISAFKSLFGSTGILPIFSNDTAFIIFSWFLATFLCHLVIDFLLFIPRYCHKLMDSFGERV